MRVRGAQLRAPGGGGRGEQLVAGLVAVVVVEGLEAVEVEHRQAQLPAVAARPRDLALEVLVPHAAVRQPGQRVGARGGLQPGEQVGAVDRDRGLGGEQPQQLVARARTARGAACSSHGEHADACGRRCTTGTQAAEAAPEIARAAGRDARVGDRRRRRTSSSPVRNASAMHASGSASEAVMPRSAAPDRGRDLERVARPVGSHSITDGGRAVTSRTARRQRHAGAEEVGLRGELVRDRGQRPQVRGLLGGAALGLAAAAGTG